MDERSKREVLAETPLFSDLLPVELEFLVDLTIERDYAPGEVIFEAGVPGDSVFVIAEGRVEIIVQADGKEVCLAELGAPQFFGEMSLIDKVARSAMARAVGQTRLIELSNGNLHIFAKNYRNGFTWVVVNIARTLSARLRDTNRRLTERG